MDSVSRFNGFAGFRNDNGSLGKFITRTGDLKRVGKLILPSVVVHRVTREKVLTGHGVFFNHVK